MNSRHWQAFRWIGLVAGLAGMIAADMAQAQVADVYWTRWTNHADVT